MLLRSPISSATNCYAGSAATTTKTTVTVTKTVTVRTAGPKPKRTLKKAMAIPTRTKMTTKTRVGMTDPKRRPQSHNEETIKARKKNVIHRFSEQSVTCPFFKH